MLAAGGGQALLEKLAQPLVLFGLAGQSIFMLRFVVQWFVSERLGRSHVPLGFWYLSLLGGLMLMVYGVLDQDPVIILGQSLGLGIYLRNLVLIYRRQARYRRLVRSREPRRSDVPTKLGEAIQTLS